MSDTSYTRDQLEALLALAKPGVRRDDAAAAVGLSRGQAHFICQKIGFRWPRGRGPETEPMLQLQAAVLAGATVRQAAITLGIANKTAHNASARLGIRVQSRKNAGDLLDRQKEGSEVLIEALRRRLVPITEGAAAWQHEAMARFARRAMRGEQVKALAAAASMPAGERQPRAVVARAVGLTFTAADDICRRQLDVHDWYKADYDARLARYRELVVDGMSRQEAAVTAHVSRCHADRRLRAEGRDVTDGRRRQRVITPHHIAVANTIGRLAVTMQRMVVMG